MGNLQYLTRDTPGFYAAVGPFLASRHVARELGRHIWDDAGKVWWVSREQERVVGLCAAHQRGRRIICESDYVEPHARRRGIYRALFAERLAWALAQPGVARIEAACTPAALPMFLSHGFSLTRQLRRYTLVALEIR